MESPFVEIFAACLEIKFFNITKFFHVSGTKSVLDSTLGSRHQHSVFKKYAINFFIFSVFIFREMDVL